MTIDLDMILPKPLKVKLNGITYSINDPGIAKMARLVKNAANMADPKKMNLDEFIDCVAQIVPEIPDDDIKKMSIKQLTKLMEEITLHFFSKAPSDSPLEGSPPDLTKN